MSFILDALRKSEHARQQSTGPGFAEIPIAANRPRTNIWAIAAIALLLVNLVGVGVLLLRRAHKDEAAAAPTSSVPSAAVANNATTAPDAAPAAVATPSATNVHAATSSTQPSATTTTTTSSPAQAPTSAQIASTAAPSTVARAEPGRNPLAEEVGAGVDPTLAASASAVPGGPPAVTSTRPTGTHHKGSVVYAPLPESTDPSYAPPADATQSLPPPRDARPATQSLPSADELAARGAVPALHLDLHVYSPSPAQRFVFVNSHKYREGEALQEGPVVEQITPDGAVLSFHGTRFKLTSN
jgi:general secretion pathway protein B